jgi:hypothetical protein
VTIVVDNCLPVSWIAFLRQHGQDRVSPPPRRKDMSLPLGLYDHEEDPDENVNLARNPDSAKAVTELGQQPDRSLPGK